MESLIQRKVTVFRTLISKQKSPPFLFRYLTQLLILIPIHSRSKVARCPKKMNLRLKTGTLTLMFTDNSSLSVRQIDYVDPVIRTKLNFQGSRQTKTHETISV